MLVLSRRPDQEFAFPDIGVTVAVLDVRGSVVKLGIQAPSEVRVLRSELNKQPPDGRNLNYEVRLFNRQQLHDLRNQLNTLSLGVRLSQRQTEAGLQEAANSTLSRVSEQFERFRTGFMACEPTATKPAGHAGCHTLLVEDDPNERELLAGFLRISGYDVVTAGDGLEALAYLEGHPSCDLVLLDMCMPRCDGRRTIQSIRQNPRLSTLKVFAVSGSEPASYGIPMGPSGIDRWFAKPLDPEALVSEMKQTPRTSMSA